MKRVVVIGKGGKAQAARVAAEVAAKIDWSVLAFPKSGPKPKATKKRRRIRPFRDKRRAEFKAAAEDRDTVVMGRHGGRCFAFGISPVCTTRAVDPHEIVYVSQGGKRVSSNRVPACRACHDAIHARKLLVDWLGKEHGLPPNADTPGNVTCRWWR